MGSTAAVGSMGNDAAAFGGAAAVAGFSPSGGSSGGGLSGLATTGLGLQSFGAGASTVASYYASKATADAYAAQAEVARNNAQFSQQQAQDAVTRGINEESLSRAGTGQLKATQRNALAANGVVIDQGSALAVLDDSDLKGNIAANTIRENATRDAAGYIRQRNNYLGEAGAYSGRANAESPGMAAFSTLLTSGGQVANSWYNATSRVSGDAGVKRRA